MRLVTSFLFVSVLVSPAEEPWTLQASGTTARLRGLSVVGEGVAWASGAGGTCLRTLDGGDHWRAVRVPNSTDLDFRDVEAFDDRSACLLSIGPGSASKIFRTSDGGSSWTLQHTNRNPEGFLDAIAFWDPDHGLALGDPVEGRFVILRTDDGGRTWNEIPAGGMPLALPGEGAFAASGTCLAIHGRSDAWFGTGGGASARVFHSTDQGRTWSVAVTPIRSGIPSAGIFSLAFLDESRGVAVGGDYKSERDSRHVFARTEDGGRTWIEAGDSGPSGYRSAVAFAPGSRGPTIIAVGPSGTDRSTDGGRTWSSLGGIGFHAVQFGRRRPVGWGVGESGRIGRLDPPGSSKP